MLNNFNTNADAPYLSYKRYHYTTNYRTKYTEYGVLVEETFAHRHYGVFSLFKEERMTNTMVNITGL